MWVILIPLVLILVLFVHYITSEISYSKFPPGPLRFPIVGSLPYFIKAGWQCPSDAFDKLATKYGPIMGLKLGSVPVVVLNSYEAIQSIALQEDLQSHIDWDDKWLLAKSKGIPAGLFFASPTQWKDELNIGIKLLRKYGFKSSAILESLFMSEMNEFCQDLRNEIGTNGEVYRIDNQFQMIFFNVVWALITGERCQKDDPFLADTIRTTDNYMKSTSVGGGIQDIYPQIIHLFPKLTGYKAHKKICDDWFDTLQNLVKKYRNLGVYKNNPTNFIEDFLLLVDKHGAENADPNETIYSDFHIIACIQDLILAGTDTQSRTMKFIVRCLAKYPHVQEKIWQELEQKVGRHGKLTSEIVEGLIYTQATLLEIFRTHTTAPLIMRKIWRSQTKIHKYELPKGSLVIANLNVANRQKSNWEKPEEFLLEHFISNDKIVNKDKIVTFGFGKRSCIGELLAKRNLSLAIAALVQNFTISQDPLSGIPEDCDYIHSLTEDLPPFNVLIKIRN